MAIILIPHCRFDFLVDRLASPQELGFFMGLEKTGIHVAHDVDP